MLQLRRGSRATDNDLFVLIPRTAARLFLQTQRTAPGFAEQSFEEKCEPKSNCSYGQYAWELGAEENRDLISTGVGPTSKAWRSFISIPDPDAARGFKDRSSNVRGRTLLVLRGVEVSSRSKPEAKAAQQQAMAAVFRARVRPGNGSRATQQEINAEEACVQSARVSYQEVVARAAAVGVQLELPAGAPEPTVEWP